MRIFPGQLVVADPGLIDPDSFMRLFNVPAGMGNLVGEDVHVTGHLYAGDVALVVALGTTTTSDVYVIGPNGGGWAPQAFLKNT